MKPSTSSSVTGKWHLPLTLNGKMFSLHFCTKLPFSYLSLSPSPLIISFICKQLEQRERRPQKKFTQGRRKLTIKSVREMGRGKIEIKRIENTNNRQVTYSKRRSGIIKKAKEISVLCDAHVAVIIFGCSGKMHEYCSPKASLVDILDQYHAQCGKRLWDAKHENLSNEIDRIKKANDNLQMQLRHLKGEDITSLNYKELMVLEDVLENGLGCVRDQKDEVVVTHRRNLKQKEEVIKELYLCGQHTETMMAENGRGGDDAYHQRLNSHMPFAFRGRPVHPESRERI